MTETIQRNASHDVVVLAEAIEVIDKALADLHGNTAEFRMGEDMAFIEAMNQAMQQTVLYGNTDANPERFNGLASRFTNLTEPSGQNIVDAGGTGGVECREALDDAKRKMGASDRKDVISFADMIDLDEGRIP